MNEINNYREGITKYLRDNYKKPPTSWIEKLFKVSSEYSYALEKLEEHEFNQHFKNIKLYLATVNEPYLNIVNMPSSLTTGIFAINKKICLELSHSKPENFSCFLKEENDLSKIPAQILAKLSCDCLLSIKAKRHQLIECYGDIEQIQLTNQDYKIDLEQAEKIKPLIRPAILSFDNNGYVLEFCSIHGWMHNYKKVFIHKLNIDKEFNVNLESKIISEQIFSQRPFLKY